MPRVYRAMKMAEDGLPVVERSARGLGVREPPSPHADVDLGADGTVVLNGKGMSVARHWRELPKHRIPERLDDGENGAIGPNSNYCWVFGNGDFTRAPIAEGLELILKHESIASGNVAPIEPIPIADLQDALGRTRADWTVDES